MSVNDHIQLFQEILSIYQNKLTGTIPPEISSMSELRTINIHTNSIEGSIPTEIGSLNILGYSSEGLLLQNNKLNGTIPEEIYELEYLQVLNLEANELHGSISSKIGNLKALSLLDLRTNSFTGTIPGEIGNITNLESLLLQENSFQVGSGIPETLCNIDSKYSDDFEYDCDLEDASADPDDFCRLGSSEVC